MSDLSSPPQARPAAALPDHAPLRGTVAVFSVALAATAFCATEVLPIGLLRDLSRSLGVSEGMAGLTVTAPGLLAAVAAPCIAVMAGRIDRRRVLLALASLLVVSNVVAMLAPGFVTLVLARALFGIGLGGFWAIGAGIGGRLVAPHRAAQATATIFAGVSVGMLVGGSGGAFVAEHGGWPLAFGAAGALAGLALLAQALALPALPVVRAMPAADLLGIARSPGGRRALLTMTLVLCAQFAAYTYVTPLLARVAHFAPTTIPLLLLYTLVGLAGNFAAGRGVGRSVEATLAVAVAGFIAAMLLLPLLGASQAWAAALLVVWGLAYGALPLALQGLMARAAPDVPEGGMALFVANFQISIALGSLAGGLMVDRLGLLSALPAGAALAAAGLALLLTSRAARPDCGRPRTQ